MTTIVPTTLSPNVVGPIQLNFHLVATLNTSANEARRAVNRKLIPELGTGLVALDPELVIQGDNLIWRVPIALSLPQLGDVGQVGVVNIDPQSGEMKLTSSQREQIIRHAGRLYAGATLQTK